MKQAKPPRIVLIEDNPADVFLVRQSLDLQAEPYSLEVLPDGAQALKFIQEHAKKSGTFDDPCVVILDLHLPKYDGLEVLRALRQTGALSHLKVIVLTGGIFTRDYDEILSLNVRLFIKKPKNVEEFTKLGEQIFEVCKEDVLSTAA